MKENNGVFVVKDKYFDSIKSRIEAAALASRTFFELQRQLTEDAMDNSNSFIGSIKVTTGLERTLEELNNRFPYLLDEFRGIERRYNGKRVVFNN